MSDIKIRIDSDAISLLDSILETGIAERASDIHLEPSSSGIQIRFRIDGVLQHVAEINRTISGYLAARIKVVAQLDITGQPRPQEGNIKFPYEGRNVDLRVSIFPTSYGECFVLRILESINIYDSFDKLGYDKFQSKQINEAITKPYGLILVTGPTGSGKSTTLFTILNRLNNENVSVVTLEDPVERNLDMVRQTQINPEIGLTFASGLRYLLRQDPNIIMVGEIRDKETAQIAVQAAVTGQLVLATIHTNNAAGAIIRLLNMEIEPFLLTSALRLVTAQRLARVNCPKCRQEHEVIPELRKRVGATDTEKFFRSSGCAYCQGKGVIGRLGIHEVLPVTGNVVRAIFENPTDTYLTGLARSAGMKTLHEIAMEKARQGVISIEEVLRLTE